MSKEALLLHAGEDTIHESGGQKKPETPRSKWQNFWYYHKWHVLIFAFVCVVIGVFVREFAGRVSPDYQIGIVSESTVPQAVLEEMQEQLSPYGEDRNGDGRVVIQVDNYTIIPPGSDVPAEAQTQMAYMTKLRAGLQQGTQLIFLMSDSCYTYLKESSVVFLPLKNGDDRIAVQECAAFSQMERLQQAFEGKSMSLVDDSILASAGSEKVKQYAEDCKKLFDKLVEGSTD